MKKIIVMAGAFAAMLLLCLFSVPALALGQEDIVGDGSQIGSGSLMTDAGADTGAGKDTLSPPGNGTAAVDTAGTETSAQEREDGSPIGLIVGIVIAAAALIVIFTVLARGTSPRDD